MLRKMIISFVIVAIVVLAMPLQTVQARGRQSISKEPITSEVWLGRPIRRRSRFHGVYYFTPCKEGE